MTSERVKKENSIYGKDKPTLKKIFDTNLNDEKVGD